MAPSHQPHQSHHSVTSASLSESSPSNHSSALLHPDQDPSSPPLHSTGLGAIGIGASAFAPPASPSSAAPAGADAARRPGKRPAARGTAFYPRKRANTACQVCRARKTKCDNKKPSCSYCQSVGANCIQSPVDLSSFDPASLKILDRLDDLERLFRETTAASALSQVGAVSPALSRATIQGNGYNGFKEEYDVSQHAHGQHQQQSPTQDRRMSSNSHSRPHGLNGLMNDDGPEVESVLPIRIDQMLQWPVFNSSGIHGDVVLGPPPNAIPTPSASNAALAGLVDMESHHLYKLLDNFFLYIHCKNPILDEASTRRIVRHAFLSGIDWSPASCLAMVICALGCLAGPFGPSHENKPGSQAYQDSQIFFHAAQKRIGILLVSSDIVGAQCLFLSGVYMMMVFQPVYAWRFFSQALAACQHFSFLAKAQNMSNGADLSPESMEMGRQDTQEQAVYWSAWKSERELRRELSLPDFDIIHSGSTLYPPFFPAPPTGQPDSPEGPDNETRRARAAWLFYLAEISLRRLTSRLCSEVTTLRQRYPSNSKFLEALGEMIPEYEAQAREWSDNIPDELSIAGEIENDSIGQSVLRGRLINLYEMLYWPFVMASLSSLALGKPVTVTTSKLAKRGLETHIHQVQVNEPGFCHRHHGAFFMIRACSRSAFVLAASAKLGSPMPPNWEQSVYSVIGMLSYWEDEDRDLTHWKATMEAEMAHIAR